MSQESGESRVYHAKNKTANAVLVVNLDCLADIVQSEGEVRPSEFLDRPSRRAFECLFDESHVLVLRRNKKQASMSIKQGIKT